MFNNMKDKHIKQTTQSNTQAAAKGQSQNNLPLEFTLGTIYILKAILSIIEGGELKSIED